jgi:branched-chain amino acid transport system ATP-binding protein
MTGRLLECRGLTVRFGGVTALDGLDLAASEGEVVGLIGPNGSGKTSLFNVLTGFYRPAAGTVRFGGRDVTGASPQDICRAGIARTFQRCRLCLPLSIFDNVALGAHRRIDLGIVSNLFRRKALRREFERESERVRELLRVFNPALADRMFRPVASESMIDRRRIEVCRALAAEPRLLLLDEPSAGMTHEETRALMEDILSMRASRPGLCVIVIEHEMGVIERVTQRCVVLNFGRKVCEGTYREVAADPGVQQAYLGDE